MVVCSSALKSHLNLITVGLFFISSVFSQSSNEVPLSDQRDRLLVFTVATRSTDGFRRFMRSAHIYKINVEVLGMGQQWEGGDVRITTGGGQKVNLFRAALEKYKERSDLVIMFVDSYDVIFLAPPREVLTQFVKMKAKIVFSAEGFCWPDESLVSQYPKVEEGKPYLNSGGFLGYAPDVYQMVTSSEIANNDDDQLFYTKIYLDKKLRKKWSIKLDHKAQIFQNLNAAIGDVELRFRDDDTYLYNRAYGTEPLIVHGNGPTKVALNSIGNYLARAWSPTLGCLACMENKLSLDRLKVEEMPRVILAVFVEHPTPFLPEFFDRILSLDYPKERMDLFIHNNVKYHAKDVAKFVEAHQHKYNSFTYLALEKGITEWKARNLGLEECVKKDCDYYFSLDSDAQITNPLTLRLLIEQNRTVLAPMLIRINRLWSNFWGALSSEGYYARSTDYIDIVKSNKRGVWNVPYITAAYLINGTLLKSQDYSPSFISGMLDPDMAFCKNLRDEGVFMYVTNMDYYGHLMNSDNYDTTHLHNDLYEIYNNQMDWEQRYIHENYSQNFLEKNPIEMPCPDVYWFPIVSDIFCQHLIEELEHFGKWSDGSNHDNRLAGGYENVPTRDIHMNQVGLEPQWLFFLREYIRPVQEQIFLGYYHDPPVAIMNFVVRYRPDEQPSLRPHHDSSTYTINIALNRKGIDYEGGGCRFIRYNCSVTELRRGWSLIHPGRLTHYHEGLTVTNGTRYIAISFVDP